MAEQQHDLSFSSSFKIKSKSDQLFVNGCTVDDIEIISGITSSNIRSSCSLAKDLTAISQQSITSVPFLV